MSSQARIVVSFLFAFLVLFGQSGFAMAKLTCLCLDQTSWSFQIPDKECPFELDNAQNDSCSTEKSCCAQAATCSADAPECNDECLIIDMSWLKADFETSSIPVVNADEVQHSKQLHSFGSDSFFQSYSLQFAAELTKIPANFKLAHTHLTHSQSFLGQWLC